LVKKDGLLTGHDYGNKRFPGIKKTVDEIFGADNIELLKSTVWMKRM